MSSLDAQDTIMNHGELIIRIDERTKHQSLILENFSKQMVTQSEFKPVRMIAYGLMGTMATALLIAIIGTVVSK